MLESRSIESALNMSGFQDSRDFQDPRNPAFRCVEILQYVPHALHLTLRCSEHSCIRSQCACCTPHARTPRCLNSQLPRVQKMWRTRYLIPVTSQKDSDEGAFDDDDNVMLVLVKFLMKLMVYMLMMMASALSLIRGRFLAGEHPIPSTGSINGSDLNNMIMMLISMMMVTVKRARSVGGGMSCLAGELLSVKLRKVMVRSSHGDCGHGERVDKVKVVHDEG